jgi:F1F0 ATPase subunit 2
MSEFLILVLASVAGVMLGLFFYVGLWWTVKKTMISSQPALWVFASMVLRMGVALTGIYFVSGGQLKPLLACLTGFFIARIAVTRLTRLRQENLKNQEASRAP